MTPPLTVAALYEALRTRLNLSWAAGRLGGSRTLEPSAGDATGDSLIGHLNLIHPHRLQVLGETELTYLEELRKNSRRDAIDKLFANADLVLITGGQAPPDDIKQRSEATGVPLLLSRQPSHEVITEIQYFLSHRFARKVSIHGVFLEVMGIGVLITGDASIGKSELALELVSRGHRLVADDAPEFARLAPDTLRGTCPTLLQDFLEVRGLGILNIRAMFGDSAIKAGKYLHLIVRLEPMDDGQIAAMDRLKGSRTLRNILGVEVPELTLPVAPGRNLAVLVEVAARNEILQQKGYDAAAAFIERQRQQLEENRQ